MHQKKQRKRLNLMEPSWNEVIALFGGTFDPPHEGHYQAVDDLLKQLAVAKVIVLPCSTPALKTCSTSAEHRIKMTQLNFSKLTESAPVEVSSFEVDHVQKNAPSYTYETLNKFSHYHQVPHHKLAFVIGTDQFENLPRWSRFPEVLKLCHWVVLKRKPNGEQTAHKVLSEWSQSGLASAQTSDLWHLSHGQTTLKLLSTDAPDLCSKSIRIELEKNQELKKNIIKTDVYDYLKKHHLYGT